MADAARAGARLVVFPEAFIAGYPSWAWRLRPGQDMGLAEQIHTRLLASAVDLGAGHLQPLQQAARDSEITVVCGLHERDGEFSRGTLYNTVVTIGPEGTLLNRHRKLMPTNPERMVWGCGDASGLRTVATPVGRVGTLICWENYMPQARLALCAEGMELLVAPTYDSGERWIASAQHIARRRLLGAGCWVPAACCRAATCRATCPAASSCSLTMTCGSTAATRSSWRPVAASSPARCATSAACCWPRSTSTAWAVRAAAWMWRDTMPVRISSRCRSTAGPSGR